MTKETEEALGRLEARLAEKFKLPEDVIRKSEIDRIVADALKTAHPEPAKSLMAMPGKDAGLEEMEAYVQHRWRMFKSRPEAFTKAEPWTSDYGKKFKNIQGFLRSCLAKSADLVSMDLKAASDGMAEGDNTYGGYLVPTEFRYEVIRLLNPQSKLRQLGRLVPMGTWKRTMPKQTSAVAIGWVTELGLKTKTRPGFGQFTQEAKVMAAVIKSSDEFLRDAGLNVQSFLAELIAEAAALEEERVGLAGRTADGDPFNGVIYASGVVEAEMADASGLAYDDLITLEGSISEAYEASAEFALKRSALHVIMKLKDGQGHPLWHAPREGNPGQILNRPYTLCSQLPTDIGDDEDLTPIILGDFKRFLWISDREGMVLKVSQDASDWVDGALDSAFMRDQTWLRFTKALSIDVAQGLAFAYMGVKAQP